MKNPVENVHSHDFYALGVPMDLIKTSRQIIDLTQLILKDSQMSLSATLAANSNTERIALTGILTNGIIYGLVLPSDRQVLYNIRLFEGLFDASKFQTNLETHLRPQSIRYCPLSRSSAAILTPDFSHPRK